MKNNTMKSVTSQIAIRNMPTYKNTAYELLLREKCLIHIKLNCFY